VAKQQQQQELNPMFSPSFLSFLFFVCFLVVNKKSYRFSTNISTLGNKKKDFVRSVFGKGIDTLLT